MELVLVDGRKQPAPLACKPEMGSRFPASQPPQSDLSRSVGFYYETGKSVGMSLARVINRKARRGPSVKKKVPLPFTSGRGTPYVRAVSAMISAISSTASYVILYNGYVNI